MTVKTRIAKNNCTAKIEGALTIYSVAEDTEKLLSQLARCQSMNLDLSAVTEFDTAGFQALTALKSATDRADIVLNVKNCSTTVKDVLDIYHTSDQLEAVSEPTDVHAGSGDATL